MKVDENICTDEQPLFCGGRLKIHENIWGAHLVAGSEKCSWWDERLKVSWVLLKAGAVKKHLRYCRVQFLFMPWRPPNPKSFTAHSRLRPSLSGQMCKSVSLKKWKKERFNSEKCQTIPNQICVTAYLLSKRRCHTRTALIYSGLFKWQQNNSILSHFPFVCFSFQTVNVAWKWVLWWWDIEKVKVQSQGVCALFVSSPLHKKEASIVVSSNFYDTKSKLSQKSSDMES